MKKGFLAYMFILSLILFSACTPVPDEPTLLPNYKPYEDYISTMHTSVRVVLYVESEEEFDEYFGGIKEIYDTYDSLTDNFRSSEVEGVMSLYDINELVNSSNDPETTIEIDPKLYELLELGLEIETLTGGYFNMTIGYIVDVWKALIKKYTEEDVLGTIHGTVSNQDLQQAREDAQSIEIIENPLTLFINEGKHYLTMKKGAKLDLGAIAKGHATQKAVDYLEAEGMKYYLIDAGSSSISVGEKPSKNVKDYTIQLVNPLTFDLGGTYARAKIMNTTITTSGSYQQYVKAPDGKWLTHIISPKTKEPSYEYYSLTLIGDDAGLLDGLSTALFCMPANVIETFLNEHTEIEAVGMNGLELVVRFNETSRVVIK